MTKTRNPKQDDLGDPTLAFAKRVRAFLRKLRKTPANIGDRKQLIKPLIKPLIKASGSVGANYTRYGLEFPFLLQSFEDARIKP